MRYSALKIRATWSARYCWCGFPCLIFFRIALDASEGLIYRRDQYIAGDKFDLPCGLDIDRFYQFRDAIMIVGITQEVVSALEHDTHPSYVSAS